MATIDDVGGVPGGAVLREFLGVAHDDDGTLNSAEVQSALGGSMPYVGTTDPATFLSPGTEYVWFQMDGSGNLVDILYGEA